MAIREISSQQDPFKSTFYYGIKKTIYLERVKTHNKKEIYTFLGSSIILKKQTNRAFIEML